MSYRNRPALLFLISIVAVLLLIPATASAWSGPVVHIADGDTITVLRDGREVTIELYGIATPESDQPFGRRAKRFVEKAIGEYKLEIDPMGKDRVCRTESLVYIEGDGECLNEELVRAGLAWVYDRNCNIRDCRAWVDLERHARESEIGLWQQSCPTPPWE